MLSVVAVALLGGRRWLSVDRASLGAAFRISWILLLVPLAATVIELVTVFTSGNPVPEGVPMRLLGAVLFCLAIGLFEEYCCRGIVLGGLLAVLGKSRVGVMVAVLISSLCFGWIHVGTTAFDNPTSVAFGISKIVQTGMFGIVMCAAVLHSRKIGGAAIFHAVNDFLFLGTSAVFEGVTATGNYTSGANLTDGLIAYGIIILVYLYPTIRALRSIWRDHETCMGPFME